MNLLAYWNSDRVVLSMYGAREVDERAAPELYGLVRRLASDAGLPMPKVYIMDNPQPNALPTGIMPGAAAVAVARRAPRAAEPVTSLPACSRMSFGRVKHHDTLTMTITATLAGAIYMLANFGFYFGGSRNNDGVRPIGGLLLVILAPIAAASCNSASAVAANTRQTASAPRSANARCRSPQPCARFRAQQIPNPRAERNPASAHLFIVNPLSGARMDNLFSTHPNVENRIARLDGSPRAWARPQAWRNSSSPPHARQDLGLRRRRGGWRRRGPWGQT